jgi:uncharacterized protein involved in cysteine biosynthesis
MTQWQKILYGIGAGLLAASAVVPGINLVTVPVAVTLGQALFVAGTFAAGVATATPGHIPAPGTK